MPKKVRVYELSRELGLTLEQVLDLCDSLGVGATTHSSSMDEAQADRIRSKVKREGLAAAASADTDEDEDEILAKIEKAKKRATVKPKAKKTDPKKATAKKAAAQAAAPKPAAKKSAADSESKAAKSASPAVAAKAAATKAAAKADADPTSASSTSASAKSAKVSAKSPAAASAATKAAAKADADPTSASAKSASSTSASPKSARASSKSPAAASADTAAAAKGGTSATDTAAKDSTTATTTKDGTTATSATAPTAAPPSAEGSNSFVVSTGTEPARLTMPPPPVRTPRPDTTRSAAASNGTTMAPGAPPTASPSSLPPVPPPARPVARTSQLLSPGGKPIPPPPPPTRVRSGGPRRSTTSPNTRPSTERSFRRPSVDRPEGATPGAPSNDRPGGTGARPGGPRPMPNRRGRRPRRRRRQREELQPQEMPSYTPADAPVPSGVITIERGTTAKDIASRLNRSAADVVRFLLQQGEMVTATQSLSDEMIELFSAEIGAEINLVEPGEEQEQELLKDLDIDLEISTATGEVRPPVITVMGHVDHGKTLLLDRIRQTNVIDTEAGGITQHIGAYQVDRNGTSLTFIDTPGHEAFTAMRARGAQATDIVILVVAADDGVMPQTAEAINHAVAADVPIVVAINKTDLEGADLNRVYAQLSDHNLVPESYGGDVITVPVSALNSEGIDDLLDQVLLVAELEELTAVTDGRSRGIVLEAHLDKGRGPVATMLIQHGTLNVGEAIVAGASWGRIRAMTNDRGEPLTQATPSTPVEMLGFSEVPRAGDMFVVAPDEKKASKAAATREHWQRQASLAGTAGGSIQAGARLEDIFTQVQAGQTATLNVVLKADVHGSLEAVTDSLKKLERPDVKLTFVSRGVGGINENDIQLAVASNASVIGFNVRPDRKARKMAEFEGVEVRLYEIIYRLLEDIQNAMLGMLSPEYEEVVTGEAQVREVFRISRIGPIAGCVVEHGNVQAGAKVRFLREGTIIWKGAVKSLRHFRDDVNEVTAGMECGIGLSDFSDLKEGDVIETYEEREIARV